MDELHPADPVCWYGWTKLLAEKLLVQLSRTFGFKYLGFRYGNVAGTGYGIVERRKDEEHLIPRALDAATCGDKVIVNGTDYSTLDGTCVRDYVHVLDVAEAHVSGAKALLSGEVENEIVNLGTGRGFSVLEVIRAVSRVTGSSGEWSPGQRRVGDSPRTVLDCAKAGALLGWRATRTLEDMVEGAWRARTK
jgi:UDP-glucose 4-epimerase